MKYKLRDIAIYSNKKIEVNKINQDTYISTENMLPNKSGVVKATKLPNQSKTNFFENKNILISNIRPYFKKIWFANFNGGCSNDVLNIKIKDETKVLPKYLYYNLLQDSFFEYIMSGIKGTKMPRGDKEHIMEYIINIPDIDKQIKIVNILDKLNLKMELNNQINNNLQELSNQIYFNFFNNKEFEMISLEKICNIKYGKGLKTKEILDTGFPVYGGNGIIGYYDKKMYDETQVLISCRGAASGKVIISKPNCFVTNNSLILECDRKYHYYIKEFSLANPYYSYTTGSAQPQITIDNIRNILIPIPKDDILYKFNKICEPIERQYFANIEENETLEQLRDTLLPKLMNGEISLDNIEL